MDDSARDILDKFRELAEKANHPCPSCGHCPTCGRGGGYAAPRLPYIPYVPYYPPTWTGPWITYTGGGTLSSGSTNTPSITGNVIAFNA